MGGRSP